MLGDAVTQLDGRREIERTLGNVAINITAEKVAGLTLLVFHSHTGVEVQLGIYTAQRNLSTMGTIKTARHIAVIYIGYRHSQRIELDIIAGFIYIISISIGVAVVVTVLVDEVEVIVVRQWLDVGNPGIIRGSRLYVVVFLHAGGVENTQTVKVHDIVGRTVFFITIGTVIEAETELTTGVALEGATETESTREVISLSIALRYGFLVVDTVAIGQLGITISAHRLGIAVVFEMRLVKSETGHKLQSGEGIDFPTQAKVHAETMAAVNVLTLTVDKRRTVAGEEVLTLTAAVVVTVATHITHITTDAQRLFLVTDIEISPSIPEVPVPRFPPAHHAATAREHGGAKVGCSLVVGIVETTEYRELIVVNKAVGHGIKLIHAGKYVHLGTHHRPVPCRTSPVSFPSSR